MNQSRCWANEIGSGAVRVTGRSVPRAPAARSTAMMFALTLRKRRLARVVDRARRRVDPQLLPVERQPDVVGGEFRQERLDRVRRWNLERRRTTGESMGVSTLLVIASSSET